MLAREEKGIFFSSLIQNGVRHWSVKENGGRVSLTMLSSVVGWGLRLPEKSDLKNPLAGREATAGCLLHGSLTAGERLTAAAAERAAERVERAQGDWRSGGRERERAGLSW